MNSITIKNIEKLTGHQSAIYALEQGKEAYEFFSGDGAGMVVQWDLRDTTKATLIARVPNNIFALKYDGTRQYLFVGTHQGDFYVIDCTKKKLIGPTIRFPKALYGFEMTEEHVIIISGDGAMYFVNKSSFKVEKALQLSNSNLRSIHFHPEYNEWIIGSSDSTIYIIDQNFRLKQKLDHHNNSIFSALPVGRNILAGSRDAQLSVWGRVGEKWELESSIPAHLFTINKIVHHANKKLIATASRDKSIKIWSEMPVQLLKVIDRTKMPAHSHSVNTLLWTDYKDYLVSGGDDKTILVWKVE